MTAPPFDQQVTFLYTDDPQRSFAFYERILGLPLVLDQGGCRIYRVSTDGFLGVCSLRAGRAVSREGAIVTLVTDDVDGWAARLQERGVTLERPPTHNPEYRIYHCFLRDPDGHLLEIQRFEDPGWPRQGSAGGGASSR